MLIFVSTSDLSLMSLMSTVRHTLSAYTLLSIDSFTYHHVTKNSKEEKEDEKMNKLSLALYYIFLLLRFLFFASRCLRC